MNHRLVKIEIAVGPGALIRFQSACACDWRSRPYTTRSVATSAHDEHRQINHSKPAAKIAVGPP
jgi:hypothetical protein